MDDAYVVDQKVQLVSDGGRYGFDVLRIGDIQLKPLPRTAKELA